MGTFCVPDREILAESALALAVFDAFPVSLGHALVVPKRHVATIFDMADDEYAECFGLVRTLMDLLLAKFVPNGFNV